MRWSRGRSSRSSVAMRATSFSTSRERSSAAVGISMQEYARTAPTDGVNSFDLYFHPLSELQRRRLREGHFHEQHACVDRLRRILRLEAAIDDRVGDFFDRAAPRVVESFGVHLHI